MQATFASLNYVPDLGEMVTADPSLFQSPGGLQQRTAQAVVTQLPASLQKYDPLENSRALGPEGEGGGGAIPPQRDKQPKFNLGSCLQEEDQLRVLAMLESNNDASPSPLKTSSPSRGNQCSCN